MLLISSHHSIPFIPSFLFLLCLRASLAAIQLPYGLEEGDEELHFPSGAPSITRRPLPKQFSFFEHPHHSLHISANGAVSFDEPFDTNARELDLEKRDIIAVFYAPSTMGKVFFRTADSHNLLAKELSAKIRRAFGANDFEADAVVLVTWDEGDEGNTFQLALAASGNDTYALLVYSTIRQQMQSFSSSEPDQRYAQAGFFSSDGRSEKLLNSGGPSIGDVISTTNFLEPGLFIYRVSGSHPLDPRQGQRGVGGSIGGGDGDYEYQQDQQQEGGYGDGGQQMEEEEPQEEDQIAECPPDPYRDACPPNCHVVLDDNHCSLCICSSVISENLAGSAYSKHPANEIAPDRLPRPLALPARPSPTRAPDLSCSPPSARAQCHASATCVATGAGHCCECEREAGFFGNGAECLPADAPLRINGVFEAALNGKEVERTDLFAYIQPGEGQQHTALARIRPAVGWSLLLLDPLSTPFGWLFARRRAEAGERNGFELSGANFTRIVNVHLGERYALVIRQEFADLQFSEHFSVSVFVSGTLPEMEGPVQVDIPEFEETYRRERPGLIRAYSERYITVRGNGGQGEERKFRLTTDQQIHFVECPYRESKSATTTTVRFERLNANFNEGESVVRFASQSRIVDGGGGGEGSPEGQNAGAGREGQDDDACSSGRHFCTQPNMICVPTPSSYRCECRPGFRLAQDNSVESGITCQQITVAETPPQNIGASGPERPLQTGECTRHDQCHQWGECVFSPLPGQPGKCKCRGWYVGDGLAHCGPPEGPAPPQAPIVHPQQQPRGTICRSDNDCGDNAHCAYSATQGYWLCECARGWRGDGVDCEAEAEPAENGNGDEKAGTGAGGRIGMGKQCAEQSDCHQNGHCVLDEQQSTYFCECLPGYSGDGVDHCESSEECSPTDPAQGCADPNQECRFEHAFQKFACQCRNGFVKGINGRCEYQIDRPSAHQCQQCGANAQCMRDARGAWNCVCEPGYTGNGFECRREANCLDDPSMCSPNAQCLPDGSARGYLCVCNYGHTGDGRTCESVAAQSARGAGAGTAESLLIGRGMAIIQRAPEPSGAGKQLVVGRVGQIVVDIEFDCQTDRIFWSDISGHCIRSALLNGTDANEMFAYVLRSPEGIAIDWPSRNIYYLDSIKNELGVLSMDGRFQKTLLKEGLSNPRALVIDLEGRQLYYSDWAREGPKIGKIALDGTGNQVFVSDDVHLPNGLVLLPQRRWLCWVDAGSQRLSCIGLDGTGRRVIYAPLEYPFGLAVNGQEERFYWTDWKDQKIHSVDVFGKGYTHFLPSAGGRGKLYGILSLPIKCHRHLATTSECARDNGGCANWCLTGARQGTISCVCPDNVQGLEGC